MKSYFHCDVNMYRKRVRTFLEYTAVPVVMASVFLTVCLLLSLRNLMQSGLLFPVTAIIGAVLFSFALLARIMLGIAEHRVWVHSKHTYIEIGLKDVIISIYAGGFTHFGEKTVLRRLVVVPFKALTDVEVMQNGGIYLEVASDSEKSGLIRDYTANTDRLGYYFKHGNLVFKEFFFGERGFEELQGVPIPRLFANPQEIVDSILAAKQRFDGLPFEKPYVFKELPFVKARKIRQNVKRIR